MRRREGSKGRLYREATTRNREGSKTGTTASMVNSQFLFSLIKHEEMGKILVYFCIYYY